ncbi:hypothetical protein BCR35DRAFT_298285 [Leucosporidium creatinivorum]|uniref:RNI-like protein n=1 Tax=Leucosporidium creatinivorum TaxID=106004 RepID=A0A1Y2G4A3_9BASI|nr:hypothetical protein BCR35DRAFT_298285 [Leucosporidium creatinivorum]
MSSFDRFRTPGGDLASFFRSIVTPGHRYSSSQGRGHASFDQADYEWEQLRANQAAAKHLDFFAHGLAGPRGTKVVLQALRASPGATSISLQSQNDLGDNGVRALLVGLKQLRARGVGASLQELNLSGNHLTDVSMHLIALHLLQPSPHPPTLTHLYLTANSFSLSSPELTEFLGAALSSPSSALRCLSLTNNMAIKSTGLLSLLQHLKLGPSTQLAQLHFSLCELTPNCAEPLARWLEDPDGGARLQVLCINGNSIGVAGLRRIARSVISGKASSLLHLESHANEPTEEQEEWKEVNEALEAEETEEDREGWKERLEVAKERNKVVLKETRLAALGLLAKGRVLFGGNPREPEVDAGAIRRGVEELDTRENPYAPKTLSSSLSSSAFPFLRLPIELQVHVLRCSLLLKPSQTAHLYQPISSTSSLLPPLSPSTLSSPLTEHQFLNLLAHCASSSTLGIEMRIAAAGGRVPSLKQSTGWRQDSWTEAGGGASGSASGSAWEDWVLRKTECDRFARG